MKIKTRQYKIRIDGFAKKKKIKRRKRKEKEKDPLTKNGGWNIEPLSCRGTVNSNKQCQKMGGFLQAQKQVIHKNGKKEVIAKRTCQSAAEDFLQEQITWVYKGRKNLN